MKIQGDKIERVKTHWRENWKTYTALGVGLVVGGATGYFFKRDLVKEVLEAAKVPTQAAIATCGSTVNQAARDMNNIVITELERQGHPGNKILWVEKGIVTPSQNLMAQAAEVDRIYLSKYLRGLVGSEKVNGQTFINLGEMV